MSLVGTVLVALVCLGGGVAVGLVAGRRSAAARLDKALGHTHDGPPSRFAAVGRLVSEVAAARADAAASAGRVQDVLTGLPFAALVFGPDDEVAEMNGDGARLLVGRHGDLLVMDAVRELVARVGSGDGPVAARQIDLAGPPRRQVSVEVRLLGGGDRLAVVEDTTERRRLEEMRRDFVANISHELKTPIGAIALLAETLSETDDPEAVVRLSQRLEREALRVGSTIDDLLLLSSIESSPGPAAESVRLADVIAESIDRVRAAAELRSVRISIDPGETGADQDGADQTGADQDGPVVSGDRRQLVSAVTNLLDNAVKYSDDGSTVTVRTTSGPDGCTLEVTDRGIGIPSRDLERVFERFYRVDRARSRVTGGTGLGLAIVRHVAHNHGGSVRVSSIEGEGSTFVMQVPTPAEALRRRDADGV